MAQPEDERPPYEPALPAAGGKRGLYWQSDYALLVAAVVLVTAIAFAFFYFDLDITKLRTYGYLGVFAISLIGAASIFLPTPAIAAVFGGGVRPCEGTMMREFLHWVRTIVKRIRRNHALEHATVHILGRKPRDTTIYARSGPRGLLVYGDLPTEEVANAVSEALARLRNGEYQLAVHPNCGTNLVVAGGLSALAALAAMQLQQIGKKKSLWRVLGSLPLAVLASIGALILAQPLGQGLQLNLTTESEMGHLAISSITRHNQGPLVYHTVTTTQ